MTSPTPSPTSRVPKSAPAFWALAVAVLLAGCTAESPEAGLPSGGVAVPSGLTPAAGDGPVCPYSTWREPGLFLEIPDLAAEAGWEVESTSPLGWDPAELGLTLDVAPARITSLVLESAGLGSFGRSRVGSLLLARSVAGDAFVSGHFPAELSGDEFRTAAGRFVSAWTTLETEARREFLDELEATRRPSEYAGTQVVGEGVESVIHGGIMLGPLWSATGLDEGATHERPDMLEISAQHETERWSATFAYPRHRIHLNTTPPATLTAHGSGWNELALDDTTPITDEHAQRLISEAFHRIHSSPPTFAEWQRTEGVC